MRTGGNPRVRKILTWSNGLPEYSCTHIQCSCFHTVSLSHSPISPVYATYQAFSESDFSGRVFHMQISGLIFFVSFGFLSAFIEPKDQILCAHCFQVTQTEQHMYSNLSMFSLIVSNNFFCACAMQVFALGSLRLRPKEVARHWFQQ